MQHRIRRTWPIDLAESQWRQVLVLLEVIQLVTYFKNWPVSVSCRLHSHPQIYWYHKFYKGFKLLSVVAWRRDISVLWTNSPILQKWLAYLCENALWLGGYYPYLIAWDPRLDQLWISLKKLLQLVMVTIPLETVFVSAQSSTKNLTSFLDSLAFFASSGRNSTLSTVGWWILSSNFT